jgi:hypothetical protein
LKVILYEYKKLGLQSAGSAFFYSIPGIPDIFIHPVTPQNLLYLDYNEISIYYPLSGSDSLEAWNGKKKAVKWMGRIK